MGIMNPYFPEEISLTLAKIAHADTFVETGTLLGETSKWASSKYKIVHTIELSEVLYNRVKDDLLSKGNIFPHLGDSRKILPEILTDIEGNVVFWLDAHYSAGETAGENDPCPLREELSIIFRRNKEDVVIIDDARCFPVNNTNGTYPSIVEIMHSAVGETEKGQGKRIYICNDQIFILPEREIYEEVMLPYILDTDKRLWIDSARQADRTFKKTIGKIAVCATKKMGIYRFLKRKYYHEQ
jgi:hypothetical protein